MKSINQQTILITGATDGIGKLTALQLAKKQARLLIHGRNEEKLHRVVAELKATSGNDKIQGLLADFASLAQVRRLALQVSETYDGLDTLINNAGVGTSGERYSQDGHELRFAVNYLAPFLFTRLLLPVLKKSTSARIVNVSSAGQHPVDFDDVMLENSFDGMKAYCQSKLALIMFTFDLAAELQDANVTANTLHPGTYLDTNMVRRANIAPLGKAESGADAIVFLAISSTLVGVTGKYFNVKAEARADAQAYDRQARKQLRELTRQLTACSE